MAVEDIFRQLNEIDPVFAAQMRIAWDRRTAKAAKATKADAKAAKAAAKAAKAAAYAPVAAANQEVVAARQTHDAAWAAWRHYMATTYDPNMHRHPLRGAVSLTGQDLARARERAAAALAGYNAWLARERLADNQD